MRNNKEYHEYLIQFVRSRIKDDYICAWLRLFKNGKQSSVPSVSLMCQPVTQPDHWRNIVEYEIGLPFNDRFMEHWKECQHDPKEAWSMLTLVLKADGSHQVDYENINFDARNHSLSKTMDAWRAKYCSGLKCLPVKF